METIQPTMLQLHIWPVFFLIVLVAVNLIVIRRQRDDRALKKYLRIQATAWTTLMSMIAFTGATYMAYFHLDLSVKIAVMIAAAVMLSSLEIRRHLLLKNARPGQECFVQVRQRAWRLYLYQLLWLVMVGGLTPLL